MPEGPEIKRAAERIAKAISGQIAERVEFAFERLQPYEAELQGRRITCVEARGKAMLTRFEDTPVRIYSHNQLYGRWKTSKAGTLPKTTRSLRLAIHTPKRSALLYSASDICVLHNDAEEAEHAYLSRLGPDLLDNSVCPAMVDARLQDRKFARRRLAGLYLDQSFLCGPGNYLRSEILFVARTHPQKRPCDLRDDERMRLAEASLSVTRRAYAQRGVTVAGDEVAQLKSEGASRRQYRHYVFARAGYPCRECGASVEKSTVSGRRLYHCPHCQPLD